MLSFIVSFPVFPKSKLEEWVIARASKPNDEVNGRCETLLDCEDLSSLFFLLNFRTLEIISSSFPNL